MLYLYSDREACRRRIVCKVIDDVHDSRKVSEHRRPVDELTTAKERALGQVLVESNEVPGSVLIADAQQVARHHAKPVLSHVVLATTSAHSHVTNELFLTKP